MSTITVTVPVQPATKEVEVSLPCYRKRKSGASYYKIVSNKLTLVVAADEIYMRHHVPALSIDADSEPASEQDFMAAYNQVVREFNKNLTTNA